MSGRPEYRRGWRALAASAVGSGVGLAPIGAYSLGALIAPLSDTFHWSRAEVGAAALYQALGMLLAGAAVGGLADRFGARPVALVSQLALAAALAGLTLLTPQVWSLHLGYFILAILGSGTLPMIWSRAVVGWFVDHRGLALGLSLVGTGIVGALLPTAVSRLVGAFGWRGAYLGMAALPLCVGLPVALLWFREPGAALATRHGVEAGAAEDHAFAAALRTRCFWQLTLALVIAAVAISGVLVHALPLLTDRGFSRTAAAAVAGLFGLAVTLGRLFSGRLLDRFRSPVVAAVMFAAPAGACVVLLYAGARLPLCAAALLCCGLAAGAESDVAGYLVAKYFGRVHFGAVYGLLYALYGLGAGVGPALMGAAYDRTGAYDMALKGAAAAFLIAALLMATVRAPRPRVRPEPGQFKEALTWR